MKYNNRFLHHLSTTYSHVNENVPREALTRTERVGSLWNRGLSTI
uniref:Uncharacterized protein n=1 Tax=Anguilla anguilla TaxID=7936 RepID=A0A0E9PSA3_ANGAN